MPPLPPAIEEADLPDQIETEIVTTLAPTEDVTSPLVVLEGDAAVVLTLSYINQAPFEDQGATCQDDRDGIVPLSETRITQDGWERVESVDTSRAGSFTITYSCTDNAGNTGEAVRTVTIESPCEDPNELPACPSGACTVQGFCVDADAGGEEAAPEFEPPPPDTTPPKMEFLGTGTYGTTVSGTNVLIVDVEQGVPFVDDGVRAYDDTDTARVELVPSVFNGNVDTSLPSSDYHVIRYTAIDAAGNEAPELQRWVRVLPACPKGPGDGNVLCDSGKCSDVAGSCAPAANETSFDGAASSIPAPLPKPPSLVLLGDHNPTVPAAVAYAKCPEGAKLDDLCDHGAKASSELDGDLTFIIMVCGADFKTQGLLGCASTLAEPGVHEIIYRVEDSKGQVAEAMRVVKKLVDCPPGFETCPDGVTCTVESVPCVGNVDIVGDAAEGAEAPPPNAAPAVSLRLQTVGSAVKVPRFSRYALCDSSTVVGALCEPGVDIVDEEDVSGSLIACAPMNCFDTGCPAYRVSSIGIEHCLDNTAPIDTTFEITFTAFDSAGLHGSATRYATIVAPEAQCGEGEHWCPKDDPKGRCESLRCEALTKLSELATSAASSVDVASPVVRLHVPSSDEASPIAVLFGATRMMRSWTCEDDANGWPECAVSAHDARDGDVSASVEVLAVGPGTCAPTAMFANACGIGIHKYRFVAYDSSGNPGVSEEQVAIAVIEGTEYKLDLRRDVDNAPSYCASVMQVRSSEAAAVRREVADAIPGGATTSGHVRVSKCVQGESEESPVVLSVVVLVPQGSAPAARRRLAEEGSGLRLALPGLVSSSEGPSSAPTQGPEAERRRAEALQLAVLDMEQRASSIDFDVRRLVERAAQLAGADEAPGLVGAIRAVLEMAASGENATVALVDELSKVMDEAERRLRELNESLVQGARSSTAGAEQQVLASEIVQRLVDVVLLNTDWVPSNKGQLPGALQRVQCAFAARTNATGAGPDNRGRPCVAASSDNLLPQALARKVLPIDQEGTDLRECE